MAFIVNPGPDTSAEAASRFFREAVDYLEQSAMARSIIDALRELPERIVVRVGVGLVDKYIHHDDGGIIEWDPACSLNVKDKARYRPQVPWVVDSTERHGFLWLKERRLDVVGTISPKVALAHEMAHAYQFFGDKEAYRAAVKKVTKPHEDHVIAIETTIVNELRARGHQEGIRWGYLDTA